LFSLDASLIDVQVFISLEINTYPRRIRCSSNLGHIFGGKSASYRPGSTVYILQNMRYGIILCSGEMESAKILEIQKRVLHATKGLNKRQFHRQIFYTAKDSHRDRFIPLRCCAVLKKTFI
jgi:hypothetical protein